MVSFYIPSKRFFMKLKVLSDARVATIIRKNMVLQYIFCKDLMSLKSVSDEDYTEFVEVQFYFEFSLQKKNAQCLVSHLLVL